jgi:hypothetical protein
MKTRHLCALALLFTSHQLIAQEAAPVARVGVSRRLNEGVGVAPTRRDAEGYRAAMHGLYFPELTKKMNVSRENLALTFFLHADDGSSYKNYTILPPDETSGFAEKDTWHRMTELADKSEAERQAKKAAEEAALKIRLTQLVEMVTRSEAKIQLIPGIKLRPKTTAPREDLDDDTVIAFTSNDDIVPTRVTIAEFRRVAGDAYRKLAKFTYDERVAGINPPASLPGANR